MLNSNLIWTYPPCLPVQLDREGKNEPKIAVMLV